MLTFGWPLALIALIAVPALLLAAWWWLRRRRRTVTVRVASLAAVRAAVPARSRWRRRIPIALFVAGLVLLSTGVARPAASVEVPRSSTTILLAIDVSRSMCATDVSPNRLIAAQQAARTFVEDQPSGTKIGIVAFASFAALVVAPTEDTKQLLTAIDGLTTSRGTAIGLAILASVDAIAEINPDVAPTGIDLGVSTDAGGSDGGDVAGYQPDAIVVLTDGRNSEGVDPVTAAQQAAARHLRVYTIGFGTTTASQMACTADQINNGGGGGGSFGGGPGGGGGGGRFFQIDEPTLTEVAELTGGSYHRAEDAEQLSTVFEELPKNITLQREDVEITVWFVLAGALLVAAGIGLSLWWNRPRPAIPTGAEQH